ncbi:Uncharacterized protein M6B38_240660 [Iris pallida]|uniref:Transposase, Ptta/En/Spm, plant n=1 Tax=Iris pallida TaxID=29817 RepID=A0AAX6DKB0_IRIPA|nr:Uncharacterized protein M6B38_240660 [Iris pallida]
MSSNPSSASASVGTKNTQESDVPPPPNGKKYSIVVDFEGAKGRDAAKWSSRCGALIRAQIPIGYEDWRKVDDFYKDNLWNELMKEFDMNVDPKIARTILEKKFPQYLRTMKSTIRARYLNINGQPIPKRVALDNRPDDIEKIWWEKFVDIEYSDKKKEQCKKNAENKAKNPITHTLGRKPYSRVYEEMAKENPTEKLSRVGAWKRAHTKRKTGEVLPCAAEKYAQIEAAEERQKIQASLNGSDGITSLEDFESDPIAEVFGSEKKKSYCRAISSTSSVRQVKMTQATKAISGQRDIEDLRQWKMELQNQITDAMNRFNSMTSAFMSMHQNMLQNMNMQHNQFGGNGTPRAEAASNTEHTPVGPKNFNTGSDGHGDNIASPVLPTNNGGPSSKEKKYVILLSKDLEEVAKGYLASHKTCHQRKVVQDGENIVWVTEVIDPEAPIFDGPQDGNYKLCDIVDGGFVIWPKYRLRNL